MSKEKQYQQTAEDIWWVEKIILLVQITVRHVYDLY